VGRDKMEDTNKETLRLNGGIATMALFEGRRDRNIVGEKIKY
jgi:hypothetical protein